jgi:hypothetical protein
MLVVATGFEKIVGFMVLFLLGALGKAKAFLLRLRAQKR